MKFFFKYGLHSLIYFFLIFIGLLFIKPSYNALNNEFAAVKKAIEQYTQDSFGVRFTYESLSPSILSAIKLKKITIIDISTSQSIVYVDSVFLKYNILKLGIGLLFNNSVGAIFSDLIVDGVTVTMHKEKNKRVFALLNEFLSNQEKSEDTNKKPLNFKLPVAQVKNISVTYTDTDENLYKFDLNSLVLTPQGSTKTISAQISGSIFADFSSVFLKKNIGQVGFNFSAEGFFQNDFSSFSAILEANALHTASFSLEKLGFVFSFENSHFSVHTQSVMPFQLSYELFTKTNTMSFRLDAHNFQILDLFTSTNKDGFLTKIDDTSLSGIYSAKIENGNLIYNADGSVYLSSALVPEGLTARFSVLGDSKKINVKSSHFYSPIIEADFSGSYDFKNKQPDGTADIKKILLPNGNVFQAELYLDKQDEGFLFFIPQIDFNGHFFTALQATVTPNTDSTDFSLEVSDYSHAESEEAGVIKLEGSFWQGKTNYIQSHLSFSNQHLDSLSYVYAFFASPIEQKAINSYTQIFAPYIISNDIYFSSNFESITYNAPALIIANTQKDREFLLFSFTGNENSFFVSQLDALFSNNVLQAVANVDFAPDYSNMIFSTSLTFNTLSYQFFGSFFPHSYLGIQGDYGLDIFADFKNPEQISGNVIMAGLPIRFSNLTSSVSINSHFDFPLSGDWKLQLSRFEMQEISDTLYFKPHVVFSGNADRYGMFFDTLIYSDRFSALNGNGGFSWIFTENILDTVSASFELENQLLAEKIGLQLSLSNPERLELNAETLLNQMYISLETEIRNLAFAHFLPNQTQNNTVTTTLSVLGTLNSPFVSLNVENSYVSFNGIPASFNGTIQLNDGKLTLENSQAQVLFQTLEQLQAQIDLKNFSGTASGKFNGKVLAETITAPFLITLTNDSLREGINERFLSSLSTAQLPNMFTLQMELHDMTGTLAKEVKSGIVQLRRTPGRYDFYAGYNKSFTGWYTDLGDIFISSGENLPVRFSADGFLRNTDFLLHIKDLYADTSRLKPILSYPEYSMYQGILNGDVTISGLISDPEFNGTLKITNALLSSPKYVNETLHIDSADFSIENNVISSLDPIAYSKGGKVFFNLYAYFEGWKFYRFNLKLKTDENNFIAAHFDDIPFGNFKGDISCDFDLNVYVDSVSIAGSLYLNNVVAILNFTDVTHSDLYSQPAVDSFVDLRIELGKRAQIYWPSQSNPLLRALVVPQTVLTVKANTAQNTFDFRGITVLRGGEFLYVNRSFYIRDGQINFNLNQNNLDPIISFTAETRERDDKGELVKISLSAENQPLSTLNLIKARLTSTPPKSEYELMVLLGQALSADVGKSNSSLRDAVSVAIDYGAQTTVIRNFENQLRNLLNFDIFSLRTSILQNTLMQVLDPNTASKTFTPGNFFDNSTVYIGKYFGNSVYVDAMVQLTYDKNRVNTGSAWDGLVLQPEIGLELTAPFATFRWRLAPDMLHPANNLWVPYSSIGISWKFTF